MLSTGTTTGENPINFNSEFVCWHSTTSEVALEAFVRLIEFQQHNKRTQHGHLNESLIYRYYHYHANYCLYRYYLIIVT